MDEELERQLQALTPAQRALFEKLRGTGSGPVRLGDTEQPSDYELSFAQRRFWLLEQLHPGEPAHHLCGILELTGALDRDALRLAVAAVVQNFETLRTRFVTVDEQPRAEIVREATVELPLADLRDLEPDARGLRIEELTHACTRQPFDLAAAPLMRAQLVRTEDGSWQLIWCAHHIAADGLSMLHLVHRLLTCYEALAGGDAAPASAPTTRYHDFAAWQHARARAGEFDAGLAWYERQLQDLPSTRLLADHSGNEPEGARERLPLPRELGQALLELARDAGCTPFVVMLTGFAAAMRRWLDTDDLVIGTPFANRPQARLQTAVGLFVNSVVLRLQLDAETSFRSLLDQVRTSTAEAFGHGDVPFEQLVQHLAPERNLDRNPIFQSMFNYVDFADVDARPAGMHWRYREAPAGTLFDFTMYVRRRQQAFELEIEYDRSLFLAPTMRRRLQDLATLLHDVVVAPERPLHQLNLLSLEQTAELARCEQGASLPTAAGDALTLIRSVAAPDHALAVTDAHGSCRRDELLAMVAQAGSALQDHDIQPGDRIALFLPRGHHLPIAALACFHAGATVVPLDPQMPPRRLAAILASARPRCVLTARDGPRPEGCDAEQLTFEQLLVFPGERRPQRPGAIAYLQYTSGSTGQPKGVLVPHRALASLLLAMRELLPISAGDSLLSITSPTFDIAWLEWLLPLAVGARVHVADDEAARDGRVLMRLLARTEATFLQATPSTCRLLLHAGMRHAPDLHLLAGGEALPDELAQQLRSRVRKLWNVYGPTETTIWSTIHEVGNGPVRIGRPIPGTNAFVVDPRGQRVPIGCQGELLLAGAGLSRGYDNLPSITAERFVDAPTGEPAYRTGDLVRWCEDGQLQFFGRADEQVKVRGHRLELGAIEAWLGEHPAVVECAVQTVGDDDARDLCAHVVVEDARTESDPQDAGFWQQVWHRAYRDDAPPAGQIDTRGWRDSRTGEPFPADVMQRFAAATARRIASLRPRHVLEVGCGTGLIVAAAAQSATSWLATDPSPAAIDAVRQLCGERDLRGVTTRVLAADQLDALPANTFDCVVINSVAQYFPDLDYLLRVLEAARNLLAEGGTVFLGDVRLRDWHGAQCAWLELHASTDARTRTELATAIEQRMQREPELLPDERLFRELVDRGIFADAWLGVRAGADDTEMDRFRVDVALTVDSRFQTDGKLPTCGDNRRLAHAWNVFALRNDERIRTVAELRAEADRRARDASPPPASPRLPEREPTQQRRTAMPTATEFAHLANTPRRDRTDLLARLREHLRAYLPAGLLPTSFTFHEQLPRLPSGKLDRQRLQPAAASAPTTEPPSTTTERRLAELFQAVLEVASVGRNDDFFALGGHSLLAARLVARIADTFDVEVSLRAVFASPRLAQLATTIEQASRAAEPGPRAATRRELELPGATMQRLWLWQRLMPGSRAYLMIGSIEVYGALAVAELQRAVDTVVERHEVLQMEFVDHDGEARLRSRQPATVTVQAFDRADRMASHLRSMTGDALLALQVLTAPVDAQRRRVAFVLHHAFADGWSIHVLQRDLLIALQAHRRGTEPPFPELPLQYLDFASWQRDRPHQQALDHFVTELRGAPSTLDLPTLRDRPLRPSEPGERLELTMPEDLQADLHAFARKHGSSTFHVMLAAVQVWLARLSGQRDFVLGTTVANRDHRAFENAIGCFVQTLPLRCRIVDDRTGLEQLAITRDAFLQAYEHRSVPFRQLLEELDTPRLTHRAPLFQVTFDWLAFEWLGDTEAPIALEGTTFQPETYDPAASKFELSLVVTRSQPFAGYLEFRTDLFSARTVRDWWHALLALLRGMVSAPDRHLAELPLVDAEQSRELLLRGRGQTRTFAHPDVVTAWRQQVAGNPTAVAIRSASESLSFAAAQARIEGAIHDLRQAGLVAGARVALCLPRSIAQLLAMHAVLQCRAAYVPIDPELPPARIASMLRTADVGLIVCTDPDDARWQGTTTPRLRLALRPATDQPSSTSAPPPDALAYVLFTSGSTGEPKGVAVSHAALANYAQWASEEYDHPRSAALHTPLGFDLSLTSLWPIWSNGGSVFVAAPGDGIEPLLEAERHGPFDLIKLTPSHLRAWLACEPVQPAALARGLVLGGERVDPVDLAPLQHSGVRIWNEYGPTEATVGCSSAAVDCGKPDQPVPIGLPIANARLYVLDERRRVVPSGVVGELWIAGAGLADGYYGDSRRSDERFVPNDERFVPNGERFFPDPFRAGERMYRSGDRASWNADGQLLYHGRDDDQLKIRGHRIEPEEVRSVLLAHPDVRHAVVTAMPAPSGSEQLIAYAVGSFDVDTLHDHAASRLPPAAVPSHIVHVATLPFDDNGKLDRAQLPSPWTRQRQPSDGWRDPATQALTAIAANLLAVPDLHPDDDFFRSGGDSILALQLVAQAADAGLELAVRDVFEHPRMSALRRVARQAADPAIAAATSGPLLPMQAWWLRQGFAEPEHYDQAVVLRCRRDVGDDELQPALEQLVARHAALRTRIELGDGGATQQVLPEGHAVAAGDDFRFAPMQGELFAADLRTEADGQRLLLRAHHVAVDAISWHVLVRELDALLAGTPLPPPPLPPIAMATWLQQQRSTNRFADDLEFFRRQAPSPRRAVDHGTEADEVVHQLVMSPEHTESMLAAERGRHRVRMLELLLAACSLAAHRQRGGESVTIDVEGHGRDVADAPSVARTVGWFTTMYPLRLHPLADALADHLRHVKERCRSVPNGGVAALLQPLPASSILCNYLGVLDAGGDHGSVLAWTDEDPGALRSPHNRRSHELEVRADVHTGRLHVSCLAADRDTADSFATSFERALLDLLDTIASQPAVASPADHPLATLPTGQLLDLIADRDDVHAVYPLTPTQQGMLFSSLRHPDQPIYREQLAAELAGPLDADALVRAFDDVAQRHELLRGEVHWRGLDEPHWVIRTRPTVKLQLPAGTSGAENPREIAQVRMASQRNLPFLFGENPLLRAQLLRFDGQVHTLLFTYHHVVLDGWSMPRLLAEIVHRYRVHLGEQLAPLPPPPPFADHVAFLARQDEADQRAFWRERLRGFDDPTPLPGDQNATGDPSYGECELRLTDDADRRLQQATARDGVTTSTLVQAAWALLLARWSERDDVLFGVTVAGRTTELDHVAERIGLFINTIPMRVRLDGRTDRRSWLRALQVQVADLLHHQHTPLPLSQSQTDVPAGSQAFDSLVVFENYPVADAMRALPGGLEVRHTDGFERTSYALTLVAIPGDRLVLRLLHAQRFSPTFAQRLLQCVAHILDELTQQHQLPLADVEWRPPKLLAIARQHASGPAAIPGDPVPIRIRRRAAAAPDHAAVVDGDRIVSYRELVEQAERIARRLRARSDGGPDALVTFDGARDADAIATLLGIWWSGAAYLPLDPEWPPQRVADIEAAARPIAMLPRDRDDADADGPPLPATAPEALAYAIATSGTTGAPKIVQIEHGALSNYVAAAERHFELSPHDRVLQFASFAFDTAAEEIWPTLCAGATLVLREPDQANSSAAFGRAAVRQRTTVWDLPTAFFELLTQTEFEVPTELRLCIVGGQAVSRDAVARFRKRAPGVRLLNTYGPSEATIVATWSELDDDDDERTPPIGRPVPGCQAWIVDSAGQPRLPGMPGELVLAGQGLARGYIDELETERRFAPDPTTGQRRYHTGDLACLRDDGQLTFLGRIDRQLKINGVRVELHAIEARLQHHPDVVEATVVARTSGSSTQLVAFVETTGQPSAAELIRFVSLRLPQQAVPTAVVFQSLPRLVSGKVDPHALQLPESHAAPRAQPDSDDERLLLTIFAELFERDDLGVDDDFFALGGDSLLAVRLLDVVRERTSIELPMQTLFADPSPRGMAKSLGTPSEHPPLPFAAMRDDAQLPASFSIQPDHHHRRPQRVLLTGATGFFGRYVLRELLRTDVERVYCLVRAADDASAGQRIADALASTATDPDARVVAVRGDLADEGSLEHLGGEPLVVVHAAAFVDFLRPYSALREANVIGTRNLVMACSRFGWTLHHVSSIGVFSQERQVPAQRIDESTELDPLAPVIGGYAQSKFVAERLVRAALAGGLPGAIHRPGRLIADRELGRGNESDFVTAMLHLVHDLGLVVSWPGSIDLTPVDYAARELVALAFAPAANGGTFHLVNPQPTPIRDLVEAWRNAGLALEATDWATFRERAVERLRNLPEHPARSLLLFLQLPTAPSISPEPRFAREATDAVLGDHVEPAPTLDPGTMRRWLRALFGPAID